MGKAVINGVEIAYTDQGSGLPVLFVHGFPLSRRMWDPQVEDLSRHVRVIAVDLRGHGESEAPLWLYTMDLFADDLKGLLDHLTIEKAVLVGFSMGGYILFAFYRKYRERVMALILADTRASADTPEGKKGRFTTAQSAYKDGAGAIAEAMIPKLLSETTRKTRPEVGERVRQMIITTPVSGIIGDLMAMAERPDSIPLLSTIRCPTLVLVGEEDGLTPPSDAQVMAGHIPGAALQIIPHAAHLSNIENSALFNKAVRAFLASIR